MNKKIIALLGLVLLFDQVFAGLGNSKISKPNNNKTKATVPMRVHRLTPQPIIEDGLDKALMNELKKYNVDCAKIQQLIYDGANPNGCVNGKSMLNAIIEKNHNKNNHEAFVILIESGADFNAKDAQGRTPLHNTVGRVQKEWVVGLLSYGASPNTIDNDNKKPIDLLINFNNFLLESAIVIRFQMMLYGAHEPQVSDPLVDSYVESVGVDIQEKDVFLRDYAKKSKNSKSIFFRILYYAADVPNIKKLYSISDHMQSKFQSLDNFKKNICMTMLNNPSLLKRYVEEDWYDEESIQDSYIHHQKYDESLKKFIEYTRFAYRPLSSVIVLGALRKKNQDKRLMQDRRNRDVHFYFA